MDGNTAFVLCMIIFSSFFWLPILLCGIAGIVSAWRKGW